MAKIKGKPYPTFEEECQKRNLPPPEREVRFHPTRRWRFDLAWLMQSVALEVEGGAFYGHGHRSVGKFLREMEKYNEAQMEGWIVIRCTTRDMENGAVFKLLERVLQ